MAHPLDKWEPSPEDVIHIQSKALDEKAQTVYRLERENEDLRTINAALLATLEAVEWVETNEVLAHGGGNYEARCPWCGALGQNPPHWWQHKPDCPRQIAIAKAEGEG